MAPARIVTKRCQPLSGPLTLCLALLYLFGIGAEPAAQTIEHGDRARYERPFDNSRGVLSYADHLERAMRSVVQIYSLKVIETGEGTRKMVPHGTGSGGVFDADEGLIVTNHHVIAGHHLLFVKTPRSEPREAQVLGTDPASDLALLQLVEPDGTPPLAFADSAILRIGDVVFAVGHPMGLEQTITMGIISGLGREVTHFSSQGPGIQDYIQTDALINSGNSGGPLLDSAGRIVGINTIKRKDSEGIGYAIPSRIVVAVLQQLRLRGRVERGELGLALSEITEDLAQTLELSADQGVLVTAVAAGSPAEAAGLRPHDVITGAGGEAIASIRDYLNFARLSVIGETYTMYVRRGRQILRFKVAFAPQDEQGRLAHVPLGASFFGATFSEPPMVLNTGAESGKRVVVSAVEPDSPAALKGLAPGDIVTEINREPISGLDMLESRLRRQPGSVVLRIERDEVDFLVVLRS